MKTRFFQKRTVLLPIIFALLLLMNGLVIGLSIQPEKAYAQVARNQCNFLDPAEGTFDTCVNYVTESLAQCTATYGDDRTNEDWLFCEQRATAYVNETYLNRDPPDYKTIKCDVIQDTSSFNRCRAKKTELRQACEAKYGAGSEDLNFCYDRAEETAYVEEICTAECNYYAETGVYGTTADSGGPGFGDGEGGSSEDAPSCLNQGGEFSWLLCPALKGLDGAITYLDNQVNSLLFVPEEYFSEDNKQLEQIWGRFRDIAYLLLIPILLVMVISTALGFQFVDAYTVKRALPRLFVAVIFIAVSLPLLRILVSTINVIGQGTYGLISSVATDGEQFSLQGLFDPNPAQGVGFSIFVIAGGFIIAKFLLGFFFLLALGVLLQIIVIFILLAFRQFLIVALVAVAPLAILAWIFPGNDKMWKIWWGSLWKLLLIYPIIMGLLAIGRVFAEMVQGVPGTAGLIEVIIKLVAYIGPFFLIPTAFKYAGGVFATLGGMVNDKSRGPLDRLRKGRQKTLANKGDQIMKGNVEGRGAAGFNRMGTGLSAGFKGRYGLGKRGKSTLAINQQVNNEAALKANPALNAFGQTDDDGNAMLFASGGTIQGLNEASNELQEHWTKQEERKIMKANNFTDRSQLNTQQLEEAKKEATGRVSSAKAAAQAIGISRANAGAAGITLGQNKARSFQGEGAMDVIKSAAARHGNTTAQENALQGFMYHARGNGRQDLGGKTVDEAWGKQSIGAIVSGDDRSMATFESEIMKDWNGPDPEKKRKAAVRIAELQGAMPGATDTNASTIERIVQSTGFDPNGKNAVGLEEHLARQLAPNQDGTQVTGEDIFRSARKYSKDTTEAERQTYAITEAERQRRMGGGTA